MSLPSDPVVSHTADDAVVMRAELRERANEGGRDAQRRGVASRDPLAPHAG